MWRVYTGINFLTPKTTAIINLTDEESCINLTQAFWNEKNPQIAQQYCNFTCTQTRDEFRKTNYYMHASGLTPITTRIFSPASMLASGIIPVNLNNKMWTSFFEVEANSRVFFSKPDIALLARLGVRHFYKRDYEDLLSVRLRIKSRS